VDIECTLHFCILLAICVPKIIKFGGDLTKFLQKQVGSFSGAHPVQLLRLLQTCPTSRLATSHCFGSFFVSRLFDCNAQR